MKQKSITVSPYGSLSLVTMVRKFVNSSMGYDADLQSASHRQESIIKGRIPYGVTILSPLVEEHSHLFDCLEKEQIENFGRTHRIPTECILETIPEREEGVKKVIGLSSVNVMLRWPEMYKPRRAELSMGSNGTRRKVKCISLLAQQTASAKGLGAFPRVYAACFEIGDLRVEIVKVNEFLKDKREVFPKKVVVDLDAEGLLDACKKKIIYVPCSRPTIVRVPVFNSEDIQEDHLKGIHYEDFLPGGRHKSIQIVASEVTASLGVDFGDVASELSPEIKTSASSEPPLILNPDGGMFFIVRHKKIYTPLVVAYVPEEEYQEV